MKKTLSIVSIGLNFLLSTLDSSSHFDLSDANQTKERLEKMHNALPFGKNTKALTLLADIQSMFDVINPTMVRESLDWLFQKIKKIKRTDRLAINFQERKARFGRSFGEHFELKYENINELVEFCLMNSYVSIGSQYVALQIRGLPQGAPPSPPLARLVCIMKEQQMMIQLVQTTNF